MAKSMRIRTDDHVMVTAGKDKGKTGRSSASTRRRRKVFVEGLNMIKRHQRPRSMKDTTTAQTGIIEKEGPIDVSNVMLLDPTDNKPTRVGVRRDADGGRRPLLEAHRQGDRLMKNMEAATRKRPRGRGPGGPAAAAARALRAARSCPALTEKFGYSTPMAAPRLVKVTVNMGCRRGERTSAVHRRRDRAARRRSPASARTSAAPRSRSPPSSSARRCRSAAR